MGKSNAEFIPQPAPYSVEYLQPRPAMNIPIYPDGFVIFIINNQIATYFT